MEEVVVEQTSLFREFLNSIIKVVAIIHRYIMSINDKYEMFLSDKMLHFIIIGILGLFLLFVIYPLFKWLVEEHKLLIAVAWIYVFSVLIAITLLIEIGQDYSGTGTMDFADMMSGLFGFILMSFVVIGLWTAYKKLKNNKDE